MTNAQRTHYAKQLGQRSRCWLAFERATLTEQYGALRHAVVQGTAPDDWAAYAEMADMRAKLAELGDEIQRRA
jgi:hypothetical protein